MWNEKKNSHKLVVNVYPLRTVRELQTWKECRLRQRRWYGQPEAALVVRNSELSEIIASFHV